MRPALLLLIGASVVGSERNPYGGELHAESLGDFIDDVAESASEKEPKEPAPKEKPQENRRNKVLAPPLASSPTGSRNDRVHASSSAPRVVSLEPAPASPYATVSHGSQGLQLVEESQLRATQEELDKVLADAAHEMQQSLSIAYHDTVNMLRGELQHMVSVVRLLHLDSEHRVSLLAQSERRLELTLMHGQYGKCCCEPPAEEKLPECSWSVEQMLLGPFTKICERNKQSYTEFLGMAASGVIEEKLLDQCVNDESWLKYTTNQVVNECHIESERLAKDLENLDAFAQ